MEFVLIKALTDLMVYQGVVENDGEKYFFFATVGIPDKTIRDIAAHTLDGHQIKLINGELREKIKDVVRENFLEEY